MQNMLFQIRRALGQDYRIFRRKIFPVSLSHSPLFVFFLFAFRAEKQERERVYGAERPINSLSGIFRAALIEIFD